MPGRNHLLSHVHGNEDPKGMNTGGNKLQHVAYLFHTLITAQDSFNNLPIHY